MTIVNKLGGSCLRTLDDYQRIGQIIPNERSILVVSASYGTTQALLDCLHCAAAKKEYKVKLDEIIAVHKSYIKSLVADRSLSSSLLHDQEAITTLLQSIFILGSFSAQQMEWILGYGEYWSSKLIAAMLKVPWVDAGEIITVYQHEGSICIDWHETKQRLEKALHGLHKVKTIVMPGFVARTRHGHRALLGFNGSDFTAAIIAKLIKASQFTKWTDIDGIYTADPKLVQSAFAIKELSYQEAAELAYFGASVLHPQSVLPAIEANIPILIKNYSKMGAAGTTICLKPEPSSLVVKGLSSITHVVLVNIEGTGFLGVCGMAGRLFHALSKENISVILISQASSEHSISITVHEDYGLRATEVMRSEFAFEIANKVIQNIELIENCAVVSAVGDGMSGTPGVAAKFFEMLYKANINILAIAQGSSERNISVVIKEAHRQKALRSLHGGFYLSNKTLSIGLIGPGGVGMELLRQIKKNRLKLKREFNIDLKIRGVMNSKLMLLHPKNIKPVDWEEEKKDLCVAANLSHFIAHIASPEMPHAAIIDCTTSAEIASLYPTMIENGCHLVTPNKKANSADSSFYKQLKEQVKNSQHYYLYEATVCAGLPVIRTIRDLIDTGDTIKRIEGIVSGTLSYIFHQCAQGFSFAESVQQAYELGYTEPDPRDDLNGLDVARKFVCLAREIGHEAALDDVKLLNMVPAELEHESVAEFLKKLPAYQQPIEKMIKKMLRGNASVAYVGIIEKETIRIELNGYPSSHPFSNTTGSDNILLIQSKRYDKQPLIIQGPGAGRDVTAAGVFADLLKLVSMI
jgi:aspartokinase/homoserine dehydrogenase 1